jgi:hypothetical protein
METNDSSLQSSETSGGSGSQGSYGGSVEEQGNVRTEQQEEIRARALEVIRRPGQSNESHPFVGAALLNNVEPKLSVWPFYKPMKLSIVIIAGLQGFIPGPAELS